MKTVRFLFAFAVILGIGEALYFYPLLSDRIAVHFNAFGAADGWGTKEQFFITFGTVYLIALLVFGVFPLIIRRLPTSLINLPHRDYWLAPERAQETAERVEGQLLLFGVVTILLLDSVFFLTFLANLQPVPMLPIVWMAGMLISFLFFTITWTITMMQSFRLPKK